MLGLTCGQPPAPGVLPPVLRKAPSWTVVNCRVVGPWIGSLNPIVGPKPDVPPPPQPARPSVATASTTRARARRPKPVCWWPWAAILAVAMTISLMKACAAGPEPWCGRESSSLLLAVYNTNIELVKLEKSNSKTVDKVILDFGSICYNSYALDLV